MHKHNVGNIQPIDAALDQYRVRVAILSLAAGFMLLAAPISATTVKPMSIAEVKRSSGVIVQAKVIDRMVFLQGRQLEPGSRSKQSEAPSDREQNVETKPIVAGTRYQVERLGETSGNSTIFDQSVPGSTPTGGFSVVNLAPEAGSPLGLDVEGGRMAFTKLALAVEAAIGNSPSIDPSGELQYIVAGGSTPELTVLVHAMPDLELGGRYIVFLHDGLQSRTDPYVGLGQGVFPIVSDPATGREIVTNYAGSPVIGVEDGEVIVRASEIDRAEFDAMWTGPPAPQDDRGASGSTLPAERFWSSKEPALSPADFLNLVSRL
jgi:hypothetical protein